MTCQQRKSAQNNHGDGEHLYNHWDMNFYGLCG